MELQQLEYFCVIAECENLTKAAQKLHVSQPSLSRSLRALEDELGAPLFDRVGRNIALNDAGHIALKQARFTLDSTDAIRRDVEDFIHDKNNTVNFYCPVPMGYESEILVGFKRKYPDINLRVGTFNSTYAERLKKLQPDITFFASPIQHKEPNFLLLGEEDIVLAASCNHELAQRESVALSSLKSERFLGLLPSTLADIFAHMFLEAGFNPKVVIEDQQYSRIMAYVASGYGLSLAPRITWFGEWNDRVAAIPLEDVHRRRYLYLKWPENTVMNWATLRFREYLIDHFNETYGFTCGM